MPGDGSLAALNVTLFLALATRAGVDLRAVLPPGTIPDEEELADPDARIDWRAVNAIVDATVEAIGVPVATRLMVGYRHGDFGVMDYVMANSPTLGDALRAMLRYRRILTSVAEWGLEEVGDAVYVTHAPKPFMSDAFVRLASVMSSSRLLVQARTLVGDALGPVRVELPFTPRATDEEQCCHDVLGAPLSFGFSRTAVVFTAEATEAPIATADPALGKLMRTYADRILDRLPQADGVTVHVRNSLLPMLADGEPTLGKVARRLATSSRTLQRRLQSEGTSFNDVLDEVRREAAIANIETAQLSADEIAYVLGFSATTAFHRAFKRWTGQTPGEFRKRHRAA